MLLALTQTQHKQTSQVPFLWKAGSQCLYWSKGLCSLEKGRVKDIFEHIKAATNILFTRTYSLFKNILSTSDYRASNN